MVVVVAEEGFGCPRVPKGDTTLNRLLGGLKILNFLPH